MLRSVSWSVEDNAASAERLAEREEARVPSMARRVDLDRALHTPVALRAAGALIGLRGTYRRLRRVVGLPT